MFRPYACENDFCRGESSFARRFAVCPVPFPTTFLVSYALAVQRIRNQEWSAMPDVPQIIHDLVEKFERGIHEYKSPDYN
jgi:hypothetical protein